MPAPCKTFISISSFNLQLSEVATVPLLSPFCTEGSQGSEKLSNLLKVTQVAKYRGKDLNPCLAESNAHTLNNYLSMYRFRNMDT